jgi:hypothetical protein
MQEIENPGTEAGAREFVNAGSADVPDLTSRRAKRNVVAEIERLKREVEQALAARDEYAAADAHEALIEAEHAHRMANIAAALSAITTRSLHYGSIGRAA